MNSSPASQAESTVNYDSAPLAELELEGVEYRIDAGKQGTALCISQRRSGSWDWSYLAEAKWDGSSLRCKLLERHVLGPLAQALTQALANAQ